MLALLVAGAAALGYNQGPRLAGAQVDVAGVVAQGGQQLRLFANQQVARVSADQLTIVPDAAATVSTSGDVIAVEFTQPLNYNTTYSVRVAGVTSRYLDSPSTLEYRFTTGGADVYYLSRSVASDSGPVDQIVRSAIDTAGRDVVYSAARIQDFAVFDRAVAVVTINDDGNNALALVGGSGEPDPIDLPGTGTVDLVRGSAGTGYLGFTFTDSGPTTDRGYSDTLFTVDLGGARAVAPVAGLDGTPLQVLDWQFLPGTSRIVAQNSDESVIMADPAEPDSVIPLGQYTEFGPVSTDGATLVVGTAAGLRALTIATGKSEPLLSSPLDGAVPHVSAAEVLAGGRTLQQVAVFDDDTGRFASSLTVDDGQTSRRIFATLDKRGSIEGFRVSPNGEFVAVETVPNVSKSVPDDYPRNGRSQSVSTSFVSIYTGELVKTVEGFDVSW